MKDPKDPTYDELVGYRIDNRPAPPPPIPDTCPVCDALWDMVDGQMEWMSLTYTCGGAYRPKPQIQNHTHKWWGHCHRTLICNKLGFEYDSPEEVLRDACQDAGIDYDTGK